MKDIENNQAAEKPITQSLGAGVSLLADGSLCYRGVPVEKLKAYTIPLFAKLVCRSRQTIWKEITLGRLRTKNRLISRVEAERWLNAEEDEARRSKGLARD